MKTISSSDKSSLEGVLFYDSTKRLQGNYEDSACQSSTKVVDNTFHDIPPGIPLVIDFDIEEDSNGE